MKTNKFLIAAVLASVIAAPSVVKAASDTASASATIAAAVTVTKNTDLEFGLIGATATAGTVTVTEAGARSGDANVDLLSGDTPSAASFGVTGTASQAITVTVPASASLTGPGTAMTATLSSTGSGSQTLDGTGNFTVNVGASLAVGANQTAGAYTGSFDVTVVYN